MLEIGSLVDGKYKILNKIGQGGMSVVYLAMNERANKQWAIKEVRKDGVSNFEVVKQGLVAEIDMLKKFNHPHLPSIIDVIDGDGSFLIVMDYIEGVSLNKKLKESGPLPQEDVIEWGRQLCDVLGYLHSRPSPIIYRDMKPANVMLKPDGNVMLIDFGTAREFKETSVADTQCLGTRGYAAPEQFGGQGQTDARTDIYCLGATLYHLVTGHNPCEYPYEMYPIRQWNPALSSGFESIILKCTQKNPNDRYQSCAELMYALEHYKDFEIETLKKQNTKWNAFIGVAAASLVLIGSSIGCKMKATFDDQHAYDLKVERASTYEDFEDLLDAAKLFPREVEPYEKAVSIVRGGDLVFKSEEHTALMETLMERSDSGEERRDKIKDRGAYNKCCYDLAMAYFFYYENDLPGLANSQKWFNTVLSEMEEDGSIKGLTDAEIQNAQVLSELSGAIASLIGGVEGVDIDQVNIGQEDATGEVAYPYDLFWEQLTKILDLETFQTSNNVTKRKVYSWILSTMQSDSRKLLASGVTYDQMKSVQEKALTDLENIKANPNTTDETALANIDSLYEQYKVVHESWN